MLCYLSYRNGCWHFAFCVFSHHECSYYLLFVAECCLVVKTTFGCIDLTLLCFTMFSIYENVRIKAEVLWQVYVGTVAFK